MRSVVDASVALCWFIPGQETVASIAILERIELEGAVVPALWHTEVTNQLGLKLRRGLITAAHVDFALNLIADMDLIIDPSARTVSWPVIAYMNLHRLTAYDATYLALAVERNLPLATFDLELIAAAQQVGVTLIP